MKKTILLILTILMMLGCNQPTDENDPPVDPPPEEDPTSITVDNAPTATSAIPKDFSFQVTFNVADEDRNATDEYRVRTYLMMEAADAITELDNAAVTGNTGTEDISFSIPDIGLPPGVSTPYQLGIQLLDQTGSATVILAESSMINYEEGRLAGSYEEWLHYTYDGADQYVEFTLELNQFGDYLIGAMTEVVDEGGTAHVVNISATIDDSNNVAIDLSGMGAVVGDTSGLTYSGTGTALGDGLVINCNGYKRSDDADGTVRGTFEAFKTGDCIITGTIEIPAADSANIHSAIDNHNWLVKLCFDPSQGEDGTTLSTDADWNPADESVVFTIDNAPPGEYAVVLVSDCIDDDVTDHSPLSGNCFGVAGMSPSEALNALNNMATATLDDMPTYTATSGNSTTTGNIQLVLIP